MRICRILLNSPYNQQANNKSLDSIIRKKIRSQVLDNERLLICWNIS